MGITEGNLKVADDEYTGLVEHCTRLGKTFEEVYKEYVDILTTVCNNAIPEGAVYQNLVAFANVVQLLQGQFNDVMDSVKGQCTCFVADIDKADKYLYD